MLTSGSMSIKMTNYQRKKLVDAELKQIGVGTDSFKSWSFILFNEFLFLFTELSWRCGLHILIPFEIFSINIVNRLLSNIGWNIIELYNIPI